MGTGLVALLQFIGNNKKAIAVGLAVLALCGYIMFLKGEINDWQTKAITHEGTIKQLNEKLSAKDDAMTVQTGTITTLETAIGKQNTAVNTLAKELQKKNEIIAQLKLEAEKKKQQNEQELRQILNEQRPKDCNSAIDYLIEGRGSLQW